MEPEVTSQIPIAWFHQATPEFQVPERVTVIPPLGNQFSGLRARVCYVLWRTAKERVTWPVGKLRGPAGAVPKWAIAEPWCGGSEGVRRARELREFGFELAVVDVAGTDSTVYQLTRPLEAHEELARDNDGAYTRLTFGGQPAAMAASMRPPHVPPAAPCAAATSTGKPVVIQVGVWSPAGISPGPLFATADTFGAFLRRKLHLVEEALAVPDPAVAEVAAQVLEKSGRSVVRGWQCVESR